MQLNIKKLNEFATIPTIATTGSAGYDLYANNSNDIEILSEQTKLIPTGIAMEIPLGFVGLVYPRSGNATKYGIILANCVGVIDSDYRGEILVPLYNLSYNKFVITNNTRIAQIIITPIITPTLNIVQELSVTGRNFSGFGSTGG